jgi:hypothetical protein
MEERRAALPKRPEGLTQSPNEPLKDEWVEFVMARIKAQVAIVAEEFYENLDWDEVERRYRALWVVHVDQVHRGKPKWMVRPEHVLMGELRRQIETERHTRYMAEREARHRERMESFSPEKRARIEEGERKRREHMRKYSEYRDEYRSTFEDE